jgi:vesicle transport through interaction with t-SNAREs protein 1
MASNAGGSELFSSYEQDFTSVTDSIKFKIEQQIPNQKGGKSDKHLVLITII